MNHVTHSPRFIQPLTQAPHRQGRPKAMPQNTTLLRFGNNALIRPSSLGRFSFSSLRPHLPFIAVASSIGLMLLNKITGGLSNIQWRWPQNPFVQAKPAIHDIERQASPEAPHSPSTPDNKGQPSVTSLGKASQPERAAEDLIGSVSSDDTIKAPKDPAGLQQPIAIKLQPAEEENAAAESRLEQEPSNSELLSALTESNLRALALSPSMADLLQGSPPFSPHSFEMLDEEDWEKAIISLSNSPFNIGSPAHQSRPHSPKTPDTPAHPKPLTAKL